MNTLQLFQLAVLSALISFCHTVENNQYLYPVQKSRIVSYEFVLTEGTVQPDNFRQSGYLINGQHPGPPIFVNQNDFLYVKVINHMTVPTTIHFHGLLQEHTVAADGVAYVTQDPIWPNQTYVYEMHVGIQTGTFAYHGHMDFDIVFCYGAIIIRDNPSYWSHLGLPYQYDTGHEHYFLLAAVYHYSMTQYLEDVTGDWKGKPPIKSITINGQSFGQWSTSNNGDTPGYEVLYVVPKKVYRLRIINMSSESLLVFRIKGHHFRVIEMDGILTFPVWTDRVEINSGQRYSILVEMSKPVDNYWITCEILGGDGGPQNGRTILSYIGAPNPESLRKQVFLPSTTGSEQKTWILPELYPNKFLAQTEVYDLPKRSDKKIVVDWHMRFVDNKYRFYINGNLFEKPHVTYLTQIRQGIDISKNSKHVFSVEVGQVIDIVFQNRVMDDGPCIQHPIHLHGHSFWVVAEGPDTHELHKLDSLIEPNVRNEKLQFRDVFTMFPYQTKKNETSGAGCGWAVIRFIANNPGVWLGHCHITTHMIIGKLFVLYEYKRENPRLINE